MHPIIDITTTALIRPQLLEKTYKSFCEKMLKGYPCRLFINIDPFGDTKEYNTQDVINVAQKYFKNVVVNVPKTAHMTTATKWLWNQVESKYFFNLEDDWELLFDLNFAHMLRAMERYPNLGSLRLARSDSDETTAQIFRYYGSKTKARAIWNGNYYVSPELKFTGFPSLIRKTFMQSYVEEIKPDEAQESTYIRLRKQKNPIAYDWLHGGYTEKNVGPQLVFDLGKQWRMERKIRFARKNKKEVLPWYQKEIRGA